MRLDLRVPRLRTSWAPVSILAFAFGAGLVGGSMQGGERLLEHDGGEYSFRYPARFELSYDSFDVATPDSSVVALRGRDGSVLMVHSFAPASELSTQQFADEIARQRRAALVALGVQGGEIRHQVRERVRSAGELRDSLRQEFEIESGGLHFAQVARYVRVDAGDRELFLSLHAPARHAARAEREFDAVLDSLEFQHSRVAANRRRAP